MDIEAHLRKGHNKELCIELANYIGNSQTRFDKFMQFFLHKEYRICQRASWAMGVVCEKHPNLMVKWIPEILKAVENPVHDAVVRNTVRVLQNFDQIPEKYEGRIFDLCFKFLIDPQYPIAIKAFSMTVCRKIAIKYPDLIPELIEVIEDLLLHGSSGIISRGKKELNLLNKMQISN